MKLSQSYNENGLQVLFKFTKEKAKREENKSFTFLTSALIKMQSANYVLRIMRHCYFDIGGRSIFAQNKIDLTKPL